MLRLVLLLLYLFAPPTTLPVKQGGSLDPLGITSPPSQEGIADPGEFNSNPPTDQTDQGGSLDPLG